MLQNNYIYDSYLMNLNNKYADEIFQHLILNLLNRMHTRWKKTLNYDSSKNISDNKKRFEDVDPIEIDGFKSNSFIKNDEWLQNTKIKLPKNTKFELEIRSMIFSFRGIKLNISWHPSGPEEPPIKSFDPKDFQTYSFIVSYKLDVSLQATLYLFISDPQTSIFYNWCNEVMERVKNELDWNKYNEKLQAKGLGRTII